MIAPPDNPTSPGRFLRSELVLAAALLGLLVVFLFPLPPGLLDLLLAFNLAATVLLLLLTLGVRQPLDFAVFPSVLLLLTLYRLALNVATTRLVLLQGNAGSIVNAFGHFVVGGNLVVGMVVFLILVIIQFVVITRGAGRISEVSARFTLDAMPGKQMAIDAEMNAGHIDEHEARRRREALMREAEFYGTMDGASKFVRGDAIAAVIITAVNLLGGVIIGLTRGEPLAVAVRRYSVLTIGDGLVTQIPALIIATASGMLVTKASSKFNLGQEIGSQFASRSGPVQMGALIIAGLALLPGLPTLPFLALGAGLYFLGSRVRQNAGEQPRGARVLANAATDAEPSAAKTPSEVGVDEFVQTERVAVEVGARLVPLVDSRRGPGLLDRIAGLRKDLARQGGVWVPAVRVRDNITLDGDAYRILVLGREVARGKLRTESWLAIDSGSIRFPVEGEATAEPTFGLPALWIAETERNRAEIAGYTVVDATSVLITHLGEVVARHAHELLGREDLKQLLDKVRETSAAVVDELVPNMLTAGTLHRVLNLLLEERVPINHLPRVLESLANHAQTTKDPTELSERVRADLGRAICDRFRDAQGRLTALVLDPRLEVELRRALTEARQLAVDPSRLERLVLKLAAEKRQAANRNLEPALLCDASIRRPLRQALVRSLPDLGVVAYHEIPTDMLMEPVAFLRPEDLAEPAAKAA